MKPIALIAAFATIASAYAQPGQPAPAELLIQNAQTAAAKSNKKVMVIFHASWCGWCKKLDAFMDMPDFKPMFASSYEIVHLDVLEPAPKRGLENPGGEAVLIRLGGANQGLPYFAVVDAKGKPIITSTMPVVGKKEGMNTGHPMTPEEVEHFMTILRKTSRIKPADLVKMESWLKSQKKG